MTLRLALVIDGDVSGASAALDQAKAKVEALGAAGKKTATDGADLGKSLDGISKGAGAAGSSLDRVNAVAAVALPQWTALKGGVDGSATSFGNLGGVVQGALPRLDAANKSIGLVGKEAGVAAGALRGFGAVVAGAVGGLAVGAISAGVGLIANETIRWLGGLFDNESRLKALFDTHEQSLDRVVKKYRDMKQGVYDYGQVSLSVERLNVRKEAEQLDKDFTQSQRGLVRDAFKLSDASPGDALGGQSLDATTFVAGVDVGRAPRLKGLVDDLAREAKAGTPDLVAFRDALGDLINTFETGSVDFKVGDRLLGVLNDPETGAAQLQAKLNSARDKQAGLAGDQEAFTRAYGALPKSEAERETESEQKRAQREAEGASKQRKRVTEELAFQQGQLGRTAREQAEFNALKAAGVGAESQFAAGIRESAGALYDSQLQMQQLNDTLQTFGQIGVDAFSAIVIRGEEAGDVFKRLLAQIAEMALQAAVLGTGPLASVFGTQSATEGGTGGLLGQIFSGAASAAAGGVDGGWTTTVTPFAKGGIVNAPELFKMGSGLGLRGEAGPEAILPLLRGPDGRLGVGGGGGPVSVPISISVDARGADPAAAERITRRLDDLERSLPTTIVTQVKRAQSRRQL